VCKSGSGQGLLFPNAPDALDFKNNFSLNALRSFNISHILVIKFTFSTTFSLCSFIKYFYYLFSIYLYINYWFPFSPDRLSSATPWVSAPVRILPRIQDRCGKWPRAFGHRQRRQQVLQDPQDPHCHRLLACEKSSLNVSINRRITQSIGQSCIHKYLLFVFSIQFYAKLICPKIHNITYSCWLGKHLRHWWQTWYSFSFSLLLPLFLFPFSSMLFSHTLPLPLSFPYTFPYNLMSFLWRFMRLHYVLYFNIMRAAFMAHVFIDLYIKYL